MDVELDCSTNVNWFRDSDGLNNNSIRKLHGCKDHYDIDNGDTGDINANEDSQIIKCQVFHSSWQLESLISKYFLLQ